MHSVNGVLFISTLFVVERLLKPTHFWQTFTVSICLSKQRTDQTFKTERTVRTVFITVDGSPQERAPQQLIWSQVINIEQFSAEQGQAHGPPLDLPQYAASLAPFLSQPCLFCLSVRLGTPCHFAHSCGVHDCLQVLDQRFRPSGFVSVSRRDAAFQFAPCPSS